MIHFGFNLLIVHEGSRIEALVRHDAPNFTALHAHVTRIVDGEAEHIAQILVERMGTSVVAVDAHHPHAVVDRLRTGLAGLDLCHRAQRLVLVVVFVGVEARLVAEVAGGLNFSGDIGEHVTDVLVVDDRI